MVSNTTEGVRVKFDTQGNRVCPICHNSVAGNLGQFNRHVVQVHDARPTSGSKDRFRKQGGYR